MGLPLIGYGNMADTSFYSGGTWLTALPLINLAQRQMGRLARTASADTPDTWFTVDVGAGKLVRIVAFLNHNIGIGGQYRLRGSNDPTFSSSDYNSGFIQVWPPVYTAESLEWEADNFWLGTYNQSEIDGYPWHLIIMLPAVKRLQFWQLEINDVGNPAGYIQGGRLFISDAWQPENGVAYGASIGWEDPTLIDEVLSGAEYFDDKRPYRVARVLTHFMTDNEAYTRAFEIQRRSGIWKEIVYIHDVDDTLHSVRRRFAGRIRTPGPVENPYPNANQVAWEFKESLP